MKYFLFALSLIGSVFLTDSVHAATYELRGSTTLISNNCSDAPRIMPINQRLQCTYGLCDVTDRTLGIRMGGVWPISLALLQETFPLTNGCQITMQYAYRNYNTRTKSFTLKQIYLTQCPWATCGSTYQGTVRYR